jgi:hypothetical protein
MRDVIGVDLIALHPRSEVEGLVDDVVFDLAGTHAVAAPDAALDVDRHRPPVFPARVARGRADPGGERIPRRGRRRRQHEQLSGLQQKLASRVVHRCH